MRSAGSRTLPQLANVQSLRGVACLVVLVYHVAQWESLFGLRRPFLGWVRPFGFCGVDLFFCISGFIITWVHRAEFGTCRALRSYAIKRFLRIYPLYWLCWAFALLVHVAAFGDPVRIAGWPASALR